mmetsp:Transcript_9645/g.26262  ORF Transcript_9645/g.26262 Transcript_9645/m.26262 type:complete len:327 (-) Transcript_9645:313-1293(-)
MAELDRLVMHARAHVLVLRNFADGTLNLLRSSPSVGYQRVLFFGCQSTIWKRIAVDAIERIAHDGMTQGGHVTIQLMVPASVHRHRKPGDGLPFQFLSRLDQVLRPTVLRHLQVLLRHTFLLLQNQQGTLVIERGYAHEWWAFVVPHQRQTDDALRLFDVAAHQHFVLALHLAFAEGAVHFAQGIHVLCQSDDARNVHRQALHDHVIGSGQIDLEVVKCGISEVRVLLLSTQRQHTRRLVDDDQILIFEDDVQALLGQFHRSLINFAQFFQLFVQSGLKLFLAEFHELFLLCRLFFLGGRFTLYFFQRRKQERRRRRLFLLMLLLV